MVNLDKLTYAGNLDSLRSVEDDPATSSSAATSPIGPTVDRVLAEHDPAAIVHFAAESHVDRSIDGPAEFVRTNVQGTFQMLDAARRHLARLPAERQAAFRFLHVSTDEVYGSLGPTGRFTETSPYDPSSPYSASKAAADHLARAYFRTYGLPVLVTNCSNNYGPYQFPEKLIPLMILNAVEGKPLPVYGDGQNVRDWLFVEDHCRALWRVLDGRPARRNLQHRRQLRAEEPRRGADHLPHRRRAASRPAARPVFLADHVRPRSPRPRPPLRHRRLEDPPRTRLAARARFRLRHAPHRPVVSRQPPVGRPRRQRRVSTRTIGLC